MNSKLKEALTIFFLCIWLAVSMVVCAETLQAYKVAQEEQENANKWHDKYVASENARKMYEQRY